MREIRNTKIIAVDYGYGNILQYNGTYYRVDEGHKEFIQTKRRFPQKPDDHQNIPGST